MLEEMATIPVPTAQLPSITSLITKVNDATQQNPQNSCKQTLFTQSSTPHSSGHEFSNADGDIMNRKRIHLEQPPITPARWYEAHMGGTPAIPIASLPPPPPVPPPVPPPPSQAALVAAGAVSHHQDAEPMVIEMDDSGPTTPKVGNIDANTHGVQNMVIREHFQPNFDTQRVGDYDRNLARLDGRRVAPPDAAVLTQVTIEKPKPHYQYPLQQQHLQQQQQQQQQQPVAMQFVAPHYMIPQSHGVQMPMPVVVHVPIIPISGAGPIILAPSPEPLIRQFHHQQQQHQQQQQFQSMMAVPFVQQPSPIAHSFPQPLQPAIIERVPSATPLRDNPPSTSIAVTSAAATSTTTATTATASVTSSATSPALPTLYPQPYAVTFSVSERALLTDDELKIIPGAARSSKPNWIQDVRQYLLQHPEAVQQRTQRSQQLNQMSSQTLAKMKQQSIERYKEIREQEREKTTAKQNGSPNEQQKQQSQKRSPKQQQQQQQQQQQGQQQQKKRTRAVSETASAATKIDATTTTAAGAGTKTRPPRLVIPPPQSQLAGRLWSPGGSTLTSAAVTARASPSIGTNGNVQIKTEVAASTDSTLTHGQHTPPSATSASSSSSSRRRLPVVRGSRIIFTATNSADLELQTAARGNPTAQSLILQNEPQLTACSLFRIAPALQSLHTLHVLSCAKFSIDGITRVVSECPTLRTFAYRMDTAPTTDQSLALLRALPRELVTLSLEFKPGEYDNHLECILRRFPQLECVQYMTHPTNSNSRSFTHFVRNEGTGEETVMSPPNLGEANTTPWKAMGKLKAMVISAIPDRGVLTPERLPHLKTLAIQTDTAAFSGAISSSSSSSSSSPLPSSRKNGHNHTQQQHESAKLYQQQRQATSKFQYDMQTIFGQYWPNIETLILVCNERLDSLYPMIAKVCPGLTRLRIAGALARSLSSSASGISTPASATVLSSSPPSSSSFSSSTTVDCNKKVAEHLAHFPAAIKELIIDVSNKQPLKDSILPDSLTPTYLNVGNALMTTHGMYRLIMSPALRTLVVTGVTFCKLGEIRTAERFVEYLTNSNSVNKAKRSSSKSLNSANESAASSTSVAAAAATTVEEMSTVRVLKIRGGSGLTAVWLTGMAKLMPELDRIELAGVSGLPESDITEFKKAHPSAKVVVTSSFTPTIFPF